MWRDSESEQDFLNFTEVAEQIADFGDEPCPAAYLDRRVRWMGNGQIDGSASRR